LVNGYAPRLWSGQEILPNILYPEKNNG
jgi:hypothetical protein